MLTRTSKQLVSEANAVVESLPPEDAVCDAEAQRGRHEQRQQRMDNLGRDINEHAHQA